MGSSFGIVLSVWLGVYALIVTGTIAYIACMSVRNRWYEPERALAVLALAGAWPLFVAAAPFVGLYLLARWVGRRRHPDGQ